MCFSKATFYDKTIKYFINIVLILNDKFISKDKACMCVSRANIINHKYYPH